MPKIKRFKLKEVPIGYFLEVPFYHNSLLCVYVYKRNKEDWFEYQYTRVHIIDEYNHKKTIV